MEPTDLLSKTNKRRVANLRAVAARYEYQDDLARDLGWTASYLSQLIGPNPSRAVSERTARSVEQKLKLEPGYLDSEGPAPEVAAAVSGDLLDSVMLTVDSALRALGWKLTEEKYRKLIRHLYTEHAKRGAVTVDRTEVDALLQLMR